ncbi:MAG: hypothetical protein DHS20C18_13140 [Saprospiraceae bacterium]|nr:MAG: hypothetical protein DHS20C18_13140 [Saprospiraceae bacterium]
MYDQLNVDPKKRMKKIIRSEEGLMPKQNPLKSKKVFIEKRLAYQVKSFFRNNWGWLMIAIIIPLWIYFYSNPVVSG